MVTKCLILYSDPKGRIDNSWHYFRRDSRETVASLLTYPMDTKMKKLTKQNFWNAVGITIEEGKIVLYLM